MAATICVESRCWRDAIRRGRCREHQQRRPRASTWQWRKLVAQVLARDRYICWLCHKPGADSADHIVRAVDGGPDELWNLRAAHTRCNSRRG